MTACAVALLVGVATVLQRGVLPHNLYLSSMFGCPGPAQHPQPRLEPWNVAYAERLATEVREADAAQVLGTQNPERRGAGSLSGQTLIGGILCAGI